MLNFRSIGTFAVAVVLAGACGSNGRNTAFESNNGADGGTSPSVVGGAGAQVGSCTAGKVCVGSAVFTCDAKGKPGEKLSECTGKEVCVGGQCQKGCIAAEANTSNVGCEFYAVDLDNNKDAFNDAAGAPWGLVLSSASDEAAEITIEQNDGNPGASPDVKVWKKLTLAPGKLEVLEMPTREVDGSLQGKNEGPGTMLSSRAFRIVSSQPVVAYQFNALRSQYSNDASLLLPVAALGQTYRALSWPSGKPISVFGSPIDRGYLTIVGTRAGTQVNVTVSQNVLGGGGVAATPKGGTIAVTLGAFDVLNLETDGMPGDLTGSVVTSSAPVAVFVGTELSGSGGSKTPPKPPGEEGTCCLDHLEEQLLPVESYGKNFVVPRSPPRGKSYIEPDYLRFLGVAAKANVKTSLPAPDNAFTLEPGEVRDVLTTLDVIIEATEPIAVGQILVSQAYTESGTGDPSLSIMPAVDQFRQDYLFLVPGSWNQNHVAIAMPENTQLAIDGKAVGNECSLTSIGSLAGQTWVARRCPVPEGAHTLTADKAFGVTAYGYGQAGSYAFVGGSNVKKIYTPPPIR